MRHIDPTKRVMLSSCVPPGPNQHGFEDYVSMFDGPQSPRYQRLMRAESSLHEHGHEYFIKNDIQQPTVTDSRYSDGYTALSDREAQEAVELIRHAAHHHPG